MCAAGKAGCASSKTAARAGRPCRSGPACRKLFDCHLIIIETRLHFTDTVFDLIKEQRFAALCPVIHSRTACPDDRHLGQDTAVGRIADEVRQCRKHLDITHDLFHIRHAGLIDHETQVVRRNIQRFRSLFRSLEQHEVAEIPGEVRDKLHEFSALEQNLIKNLERVCHFSIVDIAVEVSEHAGVHCAQNLQCAFIGQCAAAVIEGIALIQKT